MSKKFDVLYSAGEGRYIPGGVDYMITTAENADEDDVELYAEMEPVEGDECGTYDDLKAEILDQAKEKGVPVESLKFFYD